MDIHNTYIIHDILVHDVYDLYLYVFVYKCLLNIYFLRMVNATSDYFYNRNDFNKLITKRNPTFVNSLQYESIHNRKVIKIFYEHIVFVLKQFILH